jgi:uncharacterized membrane protein
MHEEREFNIAALLGCIVGAATGYRIGTISSGVLGSFLGFAAGAVSIAIIGELYYAMQLTSPSGARLLARMSPLIVLVVLLVLAARFWR